MTEGGGKVPRYSGHASLAIFPFERCADERAACQAALDVALNAIARGEPLIEFGIGIRTRTVTYGNIGTRERIEFSAIGKAANEAASIAAQCKEFGETILISDAYASLLKWP